MTIEYSAKKFSDLTQITAGSIAESDLLAVTDVSESTSSKITFGEFTNAVLSDQNIQNKATTIVTKINAINAGTALNNGLSASSLYYEGQYRTGDYIMTYDNLQGKPTLPVDLTDLQNASDFISYVEDEDDLNAPGKMKVVATDGNQASPRTMVTDFLDEGVNNLYHTPERVDLRIENKFGGLFNQYSDTFDGGAVIDSLQDVDGVFQNVNQNLESSVIRVSDTSLAKYFSSGQTLRLFGASDTDSLLTTAPSGWSLQVEGTGNFQEGSGASHVTFSYKLAFFNLTDGKIGPMSAVQSVNIQNGGENPLTAFNSNNFVKFNSLSAGSGQGILVYRRLAAGDYKLLAVLGPKDITGSVWQDYHTFDYTTWSGKNSTDNTYTSVTHFPLSEYSTGLRGWVDVPVKSIDVRATHFDIILGTETPNTTTSVFVNPNSYLVDGTARTVQICHNDTSKINEAIQGKSAAGSKSVTLNAKNYIATHIRIPDSFGLVGTANVTKITKMPWSAYRGDTPDNSVLKTQTTAGATTLSLFGIDFDGNIKNQVRLIDTLDDSANFLIDFGLASRAVLIDRCRITNVISGGIFAVSTSEFRMTTSEIVNSGLTDRYPNLDNPLITSGGNTNSVIGNRFENFAGAVDVSVTSDGVVANNIVRACGAGLSTYGSTFMISSPNVLIGAANEFLDSPDTLNTTFDAINIPLVRLGENATTFSADKFAYQENGDSFDLTYSSMSSVPPQLIYRLNLVQQLADGSTQVYANLAGNTVKDINGNTGIPLIAGKRYRIESVGSGFDWTTVGAIAGVEDEYFVCTSSGATTGGATASPDEFVGTNSDSPAVLTNQTVVGTETLDATLGQWSFKILPGDKATLYSGFMSPALLQGAYNARRGDEATTPGSFPSYIAGSTHLGVAWSCSYRYAANVGTITSGKWYVYDAAASSPIEIQHPVNGFQGYKVDDVDPANPEYEIEVTSPVELVVGMEVIISGHNGFTIPGVIYGRIANITESGGVKTVRIKYFKAIPDVNTKTAVQHILDGTLAKGASNVSGSGTLNTIDDFVLGQGLIK